MSEQELTREKLYQATMRLARTMLERELISEEEYNQIDTKITEKYKPVFGSLFSKIELI